MEAVARRLERQSASCRETLTFASVIGREFDPAVVEAVSGAREDGVYGALEEAASARLLAGLPNAPGRLRFSHILVRDALYESIPAPRRVRLHRAIGAALEMLYSGNPESHLAEVAPSESRSAQALSASPDLPRDPRPRSRGRRVRIRRDRARGGRSDPRPARARARESRSLPPRSARGGLRARSALERRDPHRYPLASGAS